MKEYQEWFVIRQVRYAIFYCFSFLFVSACIPYKSYQKNDSICQVGIEFQEYEKKFDKILVHKEGEWQKVDSSSFLLTYVYYKQEGFTVSKLYRERDILKHLKYDTLGRIKSVVYRYNRVSIGTSYAFDTLGNIIEVVDERQADKYPICFREALEIVKQKTPKHYTIRTIERDSMMIRNRKIYYWRVTTGEEEKLYWYVYYINAKTGRVFKKFKSHYAYD